MNLPSKRNPVPLRPKRNLSEKQKRKFARDFGKFLEAVRFQRPALVIDETTKPALVEEFKKLWQSRKYTEQLRKSGQSALQETKASRGKTWHADTAFSELKALMTNSDYKVSLKAIAARDAKESLAKKIHTLAVKASDRKKQKELLKWEKAIRSIRIAAGNVIEYSYGRRNYIYFFQPLLSMRDIQSEKVVGTLYSAPSILPLKYNIPLGPQTPVKALMRKEEDVPAPKFIDLFIRRALVGV